MAAKNMDAASTKLQEVQAELEAVQVENETLKAKLQDYHGVAPTAIVEAPKGLNLRSGPAKTFDILTTLPTGTTVNVLNLPNKVKVSGWAIVAVGDYTGWCMEEFLKAAE